MNKTRNDCIAHSDVRFFFIQVFSFLYFYIFYFLKKKPYYHNTMIVRFRINNTVITALVFNSIGNFLNIQLETVLSHQKKK